MPGRSRERRAQLLPRISTAMLCLTGSIRCLTTFLSRQCHQRHHLLGQQQAYPQTFQAGRVDRSQLSRQGDQGSRLLRLRRAYDASGKPSS